jgi:Protein of unknown function (DUF3240)
MLEPTSAAHLALNLMLPRQREDEVVDWLLGHPETHEEFSLQASAMHMAAARSLHVRELVQGYSDGVWIHIIATPAQATALLAELATLLAQARGCWWTSPILGFGRFDEEAPCAVG